MCKSGLSVIFILLAKLALISVVFGAIQSTCKENGEVTLTFDFGPGPITGRLLDILFEKKIPATFHVTTDLFRNLTLTEYVRRAHNEGHTIGIFIPESIAWAAMDAFPEDDPGFTANMIQQITTASNWITSITKSQPRYIRFGSKKNLPLQLRRIIEQQLGLVVTKPRTEIRDENNKMDSIWNSLSKGFAQSNPKTHSFILRQRDVIPNSVASVEKIVEFISEKGFRIVSMPECVPPRQAK
jgi:peptidoglycan/xylan/chitin deacetylase (PgdA/CDA1 family)